MEETVKNHGAHPAMRMSKSSSSGSTDEHVHFSAEQLPEHESEIVVRRDSADKVSVHLGFLQINHFYDVTFTIKDDLGEDVNYEPLGNLHLKIKKVMPSEDGEGHDLVLDLLAHKEKLMREQILITSEVDPEKSLIIVVHARVLGKGKGTPSLKSGIHCTGINAEEESENSDWQGFD
ncbi:adipose-secreted signaling protein-like [Lineus longissimus]|uniref:adipose-secreted signaling protein-like n=1 Tax=Lineus longissimus TaxID=88925 RepID=UPI002B4CB726